MFSGEVSHEAYQGKQNAAFKARGRNGFREERQQTGSKMFRVRLRRTVKRKVRYRKLDMVGICFMCLSVVKNLAHGHTTSAKWRTWYANGHVCFKRRVKMDTRNKIKSYIIREGMTMAGLVEKLAEQYGWSASVPNFSGKLRRDSCATGRLWSLRTRWGMILYGSDERR